MENNDLSKKQENPKQQAQRLTKVYADQTYNLFSILKILLFIDLLTYIIPIFLYKEFDFGIIFDAFTFIMVYIASESLSKNLIQSRFCTAIAIVPIGWLVIYDIIDTLLNIDVFISYLSTYAFEYLVLTDLLEFIILFLLVKSYISLCKATGDRRFSSRTDDFYDNL